MDWIMPLIAGLGLGSMLKSLIDNYITRKNIIKDRYYDEKKEAYLGLLNSLHNAAVKPSDRHSKEYALWQTKCELFGSKEASLYIQKIIDTAPGSKDRHNAFNCLLSAIKKDLRK